MHSQREGERILMRSLKGVLVSASVAILFASMAAGPASAQRTAAAGTLNCDVSGGVSFILGSSRALDCVYEGRRAGYRNITVEGSIRSASISASRPAASSYGK